MLVENTLNAFWFHDRIADRVDTCLVYNTNTARREGNKTDKIDSRHLVKKLTYYLMWGRREEDLPTVYIPDAEIRELRGLFATYQLHKKMKVQMKNRIHSILKQNEIWKFRIRSALRALKKTEEEQQEIKDMIYLCGYKLFKEEIELLISIRGLSAIRLARRSYKGDKRRKELARQKKQAEKREKRFSKRSSDTKGNESIDSTEHPVEDNNGLAGSS